MAATIGVVLLALFMVLMVVVLVLMSNPPTRWVDKLSGKGRDKEEKRRP